MASNFKMNNGKFDVRRHVKDVRAAGRKKVADDSVIEAHREVQRNPVMYRHVLNYLSDRNNGQMLRGYMAGKSILDRM